MKKILMTTLSTLLVLSLSHATARDWYISAETGKGRNGTIEQPAKDLGNILADLESGDRIFIAEGIYTGRGNNGHDLITVPVEIYCGFDTTFGTRDAWGFHKTVFSGDNLSKNFVSDYRLKIDLSKDRKYEKQQVVVDGCIFDNAARNHYKTDAGLLIVRSASPSTGKNPTPESGGLQIKLAHEDDMVVRNNIVLNTAPTVGAFSLWGHQNSTSIVENNLAINNTGNGFSLHTQWRAVKDTAHFEFMNNASLLNEKHDAFGNIGGSALKLDKELSVNIVSSVFAFNDLVAIDNAAQAEDISLDSSVLFGNLVADYLEFDTTMNAMDFLDEAYYLIDEETNSTDPIAIPLPESFSQAYLQRSIIDRNAAEENVQALENSANAWRQMLGQNQQAADLAIDSEVWLPKLDLEAAIAVFDFFNGLDFGPRYIELSSSF